MTDKDFIPLLKSKPTALNFGNRKLQKVSTVIGRFDTVTNLNLAKNELQELPMEIGNMKSVCSLCFAFIFDLRNEFASFLY